MEFPDSFSTLTSECNERVEKLSTRAHLLCFMIKRQGTSRRKINNGQSGNSGN